MKTIIWLRKNLFSSYFNTLLTLVCLVSICKLLPIIVNWAFIHADFRGNSASYCTSGGACWVFIKIRFNQFMYGFYPQEEQWRINLSYIIALIFLIVIIRSKNNLHKFIGIILFMIIAYYLYYGGIFGLPIVSTYNWGGLHLTLVVAFTGIIASFPLGVILALGRRSNLLVLRVTSTLFIEFWRGVPLISILFMASVMLPLFFPPEMHFNKLLRALIGISLFASAYVAEVVRGGLQAIPKGQYEAAKSLGLKYWQTMYSIVLPQTITIIIPGIMNVFIALFKDTTLVLIIGLFDFLAMVQAGNSDPNWLAYGIEGYVFAAFVYWIFCFLMSRFSTLLENKHG